MHSTWRKNTCKVIQTLTTTLIDPYGPLTPFMHSTWGRNTRKVTQPLTNIPIGLLVQIPGCILTQSPFYTIGMCKYQHHCEPDVHSLLVSPQISGPGIYFPTHHTIPIILVLLWSSVWVPGCYFSSRPDGSSVTHFQPWVYSPILEFLLDSHKLCNLVLAYLTHSRVCPQISRHGISFPTHHTIPIILVLMWSSMWVPGCYLRRRPDGSSITHS